MTDYEFTLILKGDLSDESVAGRLFKVGCDDALFGRTGGVGYGAFHRDSPSFDIAVLGAIHQVESVAGLEVVRVEPDDIVTMAEIAKRLGRTRESVRLLISGQRGPGGFPHPISHSRDRGRLWRWTDVVDWYGQLDPDQREVAHITAAINAALELRRQRPAVTDPATIRKVMKLAS